MASEIERKFLVTAMPTAATLGPGRRLRQGYLAEEGVVEVRLRFDDEVATLAVKAGRGLERTEVEAVLAASEAEALWVHTVGRRVEKVRYRVALADCVAEVDRFEGDPPASSSSRWSSRRWTKPPGSWRPRGSVGS